MSNPLGAKTRPATIIELGEGYSGSADVTPTQSNDPAFSGWVQIANIKLKEYVPNGYQGRAVLHIWVEDLQLLNAANTVNDMLVAEVTWKSGRGTGIQFVDITRGETVVVGGTTSVNLRARFQSSVLVEPLVVRASKRVEVTCNWFADEANSQDERLAQPAIDLVGNAASAFFPIPSQARRLQVLSPLPAGYAALQASWFTTNVAGAAARYITLNPYLNQDPVTAGVQFVQFLSPVNMRIIPTWLLW